MSSKLVRPTEAEPGLETSDYLAVAKTGLSAVDLGPFVVEKTHSASADGFARSMSALPLTLSVPARGNSDTNSTMRGVLVGGRVLEREVFDWLLDQLGAGGAHLKTVTGYSLFGA